MKKYVLTFLAVFVIAVMATNTSAIAAAKPTEADALTVFIIGWGHAAKKNFFQISSIRKTEGQTLNINGVQIYKMYVDVGIHFIWDVAVCSSTSNAIATAAGVDQLKMMRAGEYNKLSQAERNVFEGKGEMGLGFINACVPKIKRAGESLIIKKELIYEEFESGYKLTNKDKVLELDLYEKYLVGEEADTEIKKMDGLQGAVARALTGNNKTNEETPKQEETRIREGRLLHIKESGVKLKDDITFWASTITVLDKGTEVELVYIDQPNNPYAHKIKVRLKDDRKGWISDEDVEEKVK